MANISSYEVYAQKGGQWRLQDRLPADQRDRAFDLAKKIEAQNIPVKVIRESFNTQDQRYMESVEYISGVTKSKDPKKPVKGSKHSEQSHTNAAPAKAEAKEEQRNIIGAVITLVAIVLFCLIFVNLLVTLLSSVIEEFLPAKYYGITLSLLFFVLFLAIATPLVIMKVPWHVFDSTGELAEKTTEKKIYSSAETVVSLYKVNDNVNPSISPVEEIPIEYRRYIINFLTQLMDSLDDDIKISDNYRRLGIRFIIFGGCLGIANYINLNLAQTNAMLYEAFTIIDGKADVDAFYEAKRAYNNNKSAFYLTGIGAFLIERMLKGKNINKGIVNKAMEKWIVQEKTQSDPSSRNAMPQGAGQPFECVASLKTVVEKEDESEEKGSFERTQLLDIAARTAKRLAGELHGIEVPLADDALSVKFANPIEAIEFSSRFYREFDKKTMEINDDNLSVENKCNLLKLKDAFDNRQVFLNDLFDMAYDEEVLVEQKVVSGLEGNAYHFEFLGEKLLPKSHKTVTLYKLIY